MTAEDDFMTSLSHARQSANSSFQFIISEFLSRAIHSPDALEKIGLILEASQLLKLDRKTDALQATAQKIEAHVMRVYAVCISLRSMKDASWVGGTLVGWSFPQNEQSYSTLIAPWLSVDLHYKLSSQTDNVEKQEKVKNCKTIAAKFWLVTSELGLDEISAIKLRTNFVEQNMTFCLFVLRSISEAIPLDVYIQTLQQSKQAAEAT